MYFCVMNAFLSNKVHIVSAAFEGIIIQTGVSLDRQVMLAM